MVETYQNKVRREFHSKEQKLRRHLKFLTQQRELHRKIRKKSAIPIVAVVGYTNAGWFFFDLTIFLIIPVFTRTLILYEFSSVSFNFAS